MKDHSDLCKISQITNNIFLSGIFPLDEDHHLIKKLNINYILACVDRNYISEVHDKIMSENPDVTILYLPYNDDTQQNLWEKNNHRQINIIKYTKTIDDFNKLSQIMEIYNNKPMIEVGYHFINNAVTSNKNILVHCMAGISRSVSLVSYFLMKKNGMKFNDSINIIRNKRIIANPNDSFKLQLHQYQIKKDRFTENDARDIITDIKYKH